MADFVTAMVKGTSPDGRHYYPPFPYPTYQSMTMTDLRDLFAHLKTLTPVQGRVPNITQKSLNDWSEKYISYPLETGSTPDGDSVGGTMTEVVRNTSRLSPEDRAAIAVYIKSLPPVNGPPPPSKK